MKNIFFLLSLTFLVSCAYATQPAAIESESPLALISTMSLTATPEPTVTFIPSSPIPPLPTSTQLPCNPFVVAYCITEGNFTLQRPVQPPYNDSVDGTYRYASTANGTREPHHGVEIGKDYGTPIDAVADGVVLFAGPDEEAVFSPWPNFYGNMVVIQHAGDLFTLYAHLSRISVERGDSVAAGQTIGEMGQSGAATGSHLHFEVRHGNVEDYFSTVNPELWFKPRAASGALKISVVDEESNLKQAKLTIAQYNDANETSLTYYTDTYDKTLAFDENIGLGDLPAGRFRITLIQNGRLYEHWVEVQSGKLTEVVLVVK